MCVEFVVASVVRGAGLGTRGASCKRHEMSSIKKCGGGVGYTYLKRERLGLGLGLESLL